MKRLLSVSIRSHIKNSRFWIVEIIFYETPLKSKHQREQGKIDFEEKSLNSQKYVFYYKNVNVNCLFDIGKRRPILFQYDMGTADTVNQTIDSLLNDWSKIVYLYNLVHDFADQFNNGKYTIYNDLYFAWCGISTNAINFFLLFPPFKQK